MRWKSFSTENNKNNKKQNVRSYWGPVSGSKNKTRQLSVGYAHELDADFSARLKALIHG